MLRCWSIQIGGRVPGLKPNSVPSYLSDLDTFLCLPEF